MAQPEPVWSAAASRALAPLREIRKQQKSTVPLLKKAPFLRIVRELLSEVTNLSGAPQESLELRLMLWMPCGRVWRSLFWSTWEMLVSLLYIVGESQLLHATFSLLLLSKKTTRAFYRGGINWWQGIRKEMEIVSAGGPARSGQGRCRVR